MSNVFLISDAARKVQVEAHVLRYWEDELGLPIKRNELGHRYYTEDDIKRFQNIKELKEQGLQLKAIKMVLKNGRLDVIGVHTEKADKKAVQPDQEVKGQAQKAQPVREGQPEDTAGQTTKGQTTKAQTVRERQAEMAGQATGRPAQPESAEQAQRGQERRAEPTAQPVEREQPVQSGQPEMAEGQAGQAAEEQAQVLPKESCELVHPAQRLMQEESREEKAARLQWLLKQLFRETLLENNERLCMDVKESILKELDYQFRMQEEREEEREERRSKRDEEHFKRIDELLRKKRNLLKK